MNEFTTILKKLKEIISQQLQTKKKVLDKDVAEALSMKTASFATYKRRKKTPYQAILTYCHNNRLDVRKILFNETEPIISFPKQVVQKSNKVQVKYFKTLNAYARYLHKTV